MKNWAFAGCLCVFVCKLEAAADVEQRTIVLVVVCVDVGCTSVVLHVFPVVKVGLLVKILVGLDLLDASASLDHMPSLRVVLHERLAQAGVEVSTGELDVVGGLKLALLQAHCVVLAELGVVRVAVECESSVGSHFSCSGTICLFTRYRSILDDLTRELLQILSS